MLNPMNILTQSLALSAIAALGISFIPNNAIAFKTNLRQHSAPSYTAQTPPPVPDTGTPQTGSGAGTRPAEESNCSAKQDVIVVFMPKQANLHAPLTALWLYMPYAPEEIDTFRVLILDAKNNEYVLPPTTLSLSETPGFISVPTPPLETGKQYTWTVSIFCDADDREDRISLSGVLQAATSAEDSWYEQFNRLAEQRRSNPADEAILAEWTRLLESLELTELVAEPITPCCSSNNP